MRRARAPWVAQSCCNLAKDDCQDPIMMPASRYDASYDVRPGTRCRAIICLVCVVCACAILPLQAQTAVPTPQQMIEQLKPPRTRSLRNLSVEAAPAPDSAEAGTSPDNKGAGAATSSAAVSSAAPTLPTARPALSLLIQFDFNSARVRPESQQALGNLSQALQSTELAGSKFAVEGHTDGRGSAEHNQKLSQQRALAVRDFLKTRGVDEDRLLAAGKGATELANSAEPFAPENRRVRIVNLD